MFKEVDPPKTSNNKQPQNGHEAARVTHGTLARPSLYGQKVVEYCVLELVDSFGCEEGRLVLGDVLVGWAPVVRAPHPPRVEMTAYQQDKQTRKVASCR